MTVVAVLALVGVFLACPEAEATYAYNRPTSRNARHHGGIVNPTLATLGCFCVSLRDHRFVVRRADQGAGAGPE